MGVPRLFKWLSERYPCIVSSLTEATIPTVDNLYLDMNGIIHNCTHKDDELKAQLTEKEMILKIFRYIDQLFQLIKPSKYFFLALDGVAPRAKMNQQRSRRFRKVFDEQQLRKKLEQKGEKVPERDNLFDSNCITPGTEFMAKLSMHLKYFIHSKMQTDVKWQQCQIILSGHEVPGEGEHKIMNFIRGRKMQAGYEPNERHCLYGLDADLICLGLVTHEPHFMLLREDVFEQYRSRDSKEKSSNKPFAEKFHLLHLCALRQYLDFEFRQALLEQQLSFEYDLERIIDDFVFFIFFTGNDFLPHMPTLDIKEGSINTMMDIYKQILPKSGYLTELGDVHLERVQEFVRALASQESSMMEQRYTARLRENRKTRRRRGANKQSVDSEGFKTVGGGSGSNKAAVAHPESEVTVVENASSANVLQSFAEEQPSPGSLKKHLLKQEELFVSDGDDKEQDMGLVVGMSSVMEFNAPQSSTSNYGVDAAGEDEELEDEEGVEVEEVNDLLLKSIGDDGFDFNIWHKAYYSTKLNIDYELREEVDKVVRSYAEGLVWVFKYYYNQLVSWRWFYPFHYAPIATDLVNIGKYASDIVFDAGTPFRPFEQLLGVLPEGSCKILPEPFRKLYLEASPIHDFYPKDFFIDREGTKYDYEGVSLLPFIDETRLLDAVKSVDDVLLSEAEKKRNRFGDNFLFTYDTSVSVHIASSLEENALPDIINSHVKEEVIELPKYEKFLPKLCDGVKIGKKNLEGFPILDCKKTLVEEKDVGIALFGHPSKKPSLVVNLNPQYGKEQMMDDEFVIEESVKVSQDLKKFIGKKVYIGYPYPRIGILTSIADERASYYDESGEPEFHSEKDSEMFRKEYSYHKNVLLRRYGLDVGNVKILVFVKLFKGMKRDKFGIKKSFHRDEFAYPHSLMILPDDYEPTADSKFAESGPQAIEKEYPMDSTVLVLGDQSYASLGKVAGYDKKLLKVSLTTPYSDQTPRPKFPKEAVEEFAAEKYFPLHIAAKKLSLSKKSLGLLIGSIRLELSNSKLTPNIGLGLRSKKSSKRIVGYCKCDFNEQNLDDSYFLNFDGGSLFSKPLSNKFSVGGTFGDWELSDKALTLITNFCQAFPDFIGKLEQDMSFRCELFFPNTLKDNHEKDKYYQSKILEITKWIDEQGFRSLPFVDIEQDVLPLSALKAIEEAAIEFSKQPVQTPAALQSIIVDPAFVHKPEDPCPNLFYIADFSLGQRVMQMSGSGSARFGLVGTLVGIDGDNGQVIFDQEFVGGSTFGSRLSSARGAIISLKSLVNLDKKKFVRVYDNDNNQQKKNNYKQNVDYTKEHYFTTSSYNYDIPKVQNNQKQQPQTTTNQQASANSNQKQPFKPRQSYQPNNKNTNTGSNFKILASNEAKNVGEQQQPQQAGGVKLGKNGKPKHEKRRLEAQQQQGNVQQQTASVGQSAAQQPQEGASSSTTATVGAGATGASSEDFNPSELFKQSRAKHRQNRVQKQGSSTTGTQDSAQDYLNMLQNQNKQ